MRNSNSAGVSGELRPGRRRLLTLGAAVATMGLGGCGRGRSADEPIALSSWNIPENLAAYRKYAREHERENPEVSLRVQITGSGDFNQWFTTILAADNAPDIIRITPQVFGRYASNGGLIDISEYLPAGYGDDFLDTFWGTVRGDDGVFGIPHQTDTFATFYRTDVLEEIGVEPPRRLEDAWDWEEFTELAYEVQAVTGQYAFTYGFTGDNTAYRWLPILYMHGGSLLDEDLRTPTIGNDAGIEALEWSQRWYRDELMSPANTIKNTQSGDSETLLANRQVGFMLHGSWIMATMPDFMDDADWDVTYMIRDVAEASDLGGNILAVTRSSARPEQAAEFLSYVCNPENMRHFCRTGLMLPVRRSLVDSDIGYEYQPELAQRFVEQAVTIPSHMALVQTMEQFNSINQLLADYLDLCFLGQQTPRETAESISEGIRRVLG